MAKVAAERFPETLRALPAFKQVPGPGRLFEGSGTQLFVSSCQGRYSEALYEVGSP